MKIGLQIPRFAWTENFGPTLAAIGKTADEGGFASIWVMDHFFQIQGVGQPEEPMLEGYTTLAYLAAATKQARLGTMVTGVNYRAPGFLLKVVTTLDVLSGGRAWLGIGAGWFEREAHGLGMPFPPLKERFERLEETLQLAKQVWTGDFAPFHGKHYQLEEPIISPLPISKPHPPILIGGAGEQKTLRMVAQYADACNLFPMGNDVIAQKLNVLKEHCTALGRDYNEIERTLLLPLTGSRQLDIPAMIQNCHEWAALGIQHVILSDIPDLHTLRHLETVARDLIPAVRDL